MDDKRLEEIRQLKAQTMSQVGTPTMFIINLQNGLRDILTAYDAKCAELAAFKAEVDRRDKAIGELRDQLYCAQQAHDCQKSINAINESQLTAAREEIERLKAAVGGLDPKFQEALNKCTAACDRINVTRQSESCYSAIDSARRYISICRNAVAALVEPEVKNGE